MISFATSAICRPVEHSSPMEAHWFGVVPDVSHASLVTP
jgi:hypothetical protein